MGDVTSGGNTTDFISKRTIRREEQNLAQLRHQCDLMERFQIPEIEDQLAEKRIELNANLQRIVDLKNKIDEMKRTKE